MAPDGSSNNYQRGLELAEAGKHQQALACIEEHLGSHPEDPQALNDMGAILYCLGRSEEAINHFVKARTLKNDSPEIIWNLVEAYLDVGKTEQTVEIFDDMERMGILNADVLNRTANVFLNQENKAGAIESLLRSLRIWPQQDVLRPMVQVIRSKRPKVAFFCGADGTTFLDKIIDFARERFEIRTFDGQTEQQLYELMKWSDISWFEWCTNLAAVGSRMPKVCKNIIRLHRYESYLHWPLEVNWDNVDFLITVGNDFVREELRKKVPDIENKTTVMRIPNGVNLEKIPFNGRDRGKNIAFLSNLRMVKNPAFVLQCMQKLHYIDPEYRLFFAGEFQDAVVEQYLRHMVEALKLNGCVFFDGWQGDVISWLEDKHYIVSTSMIESQGMGVLEGMACGLKPVVHNFPGAGQIFPSEFLFNISEEFCEQIISEKYEPQRYRKFIEESYPLQKQLREINGILTKLENDIELEQAKTAFQGDTTQSRRFSGPGSVRTLSDSKTTREYDCVTF